MRIITIVIAGAFTTCAAIPAMAATKAGAWSPTYNTCAAFVMNRGIAINERDSSEQGPSAYQQFMASCLAGKVTPDRQIPEKWASCVRRGIKAHERRASEGADPPWPQIMAACVAGRTY